MTADTPRGSLSPREPTFPKWIGLGGWQFGMKGYYGLAELVTSPGKVGESVKCGHRHRSYREAKECGQRLAAQQAR